MADVAGSYNITETEIAEALLKMRYGDLMKVATSLFDMWSDGEYADQATGMAEMLHAWAHAVLDKDEEE